MTVLMEVTEGENMTPWETMSELLKAAGHVRAWG